MKQLISHAGDILDIVNLNQPVFKTAILTISVCTCNSVRNLLPIFHDKCSWQPDRLDESSEIRQALEAKWVWAWHVSPFWAENYFREGIHKSPQHTHPKSRLGLLQKPSYNSHPSPDHDYAFNSAACSSALWLSLQIAISGATYLSLHFVPFQDISRHLESGREYLSVASAFFILLCSEGQTSNSNKKFTFRPLRDITQ